MTEISSRPISLRIHAGWCDDQSIFSILRTHLKDGDHWNNIILVDEGEPDWWVVLNYPRPGFNPDPSRTLYYQFEPSWIRSKWPYPWSDPPVNYVAGCYPISRHYMPIKWGASYRKSWKYLAEHSPAKSHLISAVISDKNHSPLAKLRREFIINHASDISEIDIFGHWKSSPCRAYRGSLHDKSHGLLPYKYTVAIENCHERNYFTEKITDAIVSETLAFYSGCPNLVDFIDPNCFIEIDFADPINARDVIEESIASDQWRLRLSALREEKKKILHDKHFFADIERHINLAMKSEC